MARAWSFCTPPRTAAVHAVLRGARNGQRTTLGTLDGVG